VAGTTLMMGRRSVEISNPDKAYFPGDDLTKGDLVDYYRRVAEVMLPYVKDRPLTLHRFPDGIDGEGFYQQQRPDWFPDWVAGVELERRGGGSVVHTVVDSAAALVVVANSGCITPHLWLSRSDRPEHPDQLIFDLDPPSEGDFDAVRFAARRLRGLLDELGLVPLVKATGSKGLHVVAPLRRRHGFDEVRDFCRRVAELLAARHPDRLTTAQRTNRRRGRLYLDVQRNAYGQHAVAPYAVRALPGAPVAAPLEWSELNRSGLGPRSTTMSNLFRRLGQRDDPWQGAWRKARSLDRPLDRLAGLEQEQER
jgi:bifunctional non-homologous end joining protein LigD